MSVYSHLCQVIKAALCLSKLIVCVLQVRALVHTGVVKYLEFKAVDGSYVLNKNRVERVPATDFEALKSPLMGLFEKRRARNFFLCAPAPGMRLGVSICRFILTVIALSVKGLSQVQQTESRLICWLWISWSHLRHEWVCLYQISFAYNSYSAPSFPM